MSQSAAIRRRKQIAKGNKHLPKIGRSVHKSTNIADRERRAAKQRES